MTEAKFRLLNNIASCFKSENNSTFNLLRSNYLMKCKNIARGYNIANKQFSSATRCLRCCLEWTKNTDVTLKPIKLSKRQKRRLKRLKSSNTDKCNFDKKLSLHGNKMEQVCSFCGHSTITYLKKPENPITRKNLNDKYQNLSQSKQTDVELMKENTNNKGKNIQYNVNYAKKKQNFEVNIYSKTYDIFALNNKANTLANTVKEPPKIIKNNKRKKDKFAGLCEKAVLASAKWKEETKKLDKLNLFLKPST